jgi:Zn-finger nucleic acid-binding protein
VVVPRTVLLRLLPALAPRVDLDRPMQPVPDPGGRLDCPMCGRPMESHGYMEARFVQIDRCPSCDVIFADGGELSAMAEQWARTQARRTERQDFVLSELRRTWWKAPYDQ